MDNETIRRVNAGHAAEIERLKTQLWKYGKHLTACRLQGRTETWCDCGWKEVRATLVPTNTPQSDAFSEPRES